MKLKTITFLTSLLLAIMGISLNAQINGKAFQPINSTTSNPIYFYIESASNGTVQANGLTTNARGKVIYPNGNGSKMKYGDIPSNNENALWAFIADADGVKLQNKGTSYYLIESHTASSNTTNTAVSYESIEGATNQFAIRNTNVPSYMLAWKNDLLDRWKPHLGANSMTAWYIILPKDINVAIDNATNVLANTIEGNGPNQFPTNVRATLQLEIDLAKITKNNSNATNDQKETAAMTLNDAIVTYYSFLSSGGISISEAQVIQDINFSGRGNDNEEILKINLSTKGSAETTISNLVFKMTGTTDINDVEEVKLYTTGTKTEFDARNPFTKGTILLGSTIPTNGEITLNTAGNLVEGNNHLWLTYKVKETALEGNKLDAEVISITTSEETYTFENGNPTGSREVLLRRTLVFAPGDYGSKNYRIPAICTAADNTLVTITDKRKYNSTDLPEDIDLVCRRSTDKGKTWSEPVTVAQGTGRGKGYGDAVIIKSNTGKLVALFVGGTGLWTSTPTNPIRAYSIESTDNGVTWTQPKDITSQIYGAECSDPQRSQWKGMFFGSGQGLCTKNGRLMVVCAANIPGENGLHNYTVYSDDDGATWKVSNRAITGGDEAKVIELNNGDILMSSRTSGNRLWAKSTDGGVNWGQKNSWSEIWGNACDADIVRYTSTENGYDKNRILHTLPNASDRRNVTMWISYDEAETWPIKKTICSEKSAYSSITILDDGTIGVYLEEDDSTPYKMYFLNFSLNWLTNGSDSFTPKGTELVKAPVISPEGGRYGDSQSITITSATEGATIYYTTDGSTPNTNSNLYTAPFELDHSATIKAIAIKTGMANSVVVSNSYTIGWLIPEQIVAVGNDRYAVSITTTNADKNNINYSASTAPASHYIYHNSETIEAKAGSNFTLNLEALKNQGDGFQWCQVIILADWNRDFTFTEDERIAIIGNRTANNGNTTLSISQNITIPTNANTEAPTRLRVVYTDGWRSTSYKDLGEDPVHKGRMYDLNLKITPNSPSSVENSKLNNFVISSNFVKDSINILFQESNNYSISIFSTQGRIIEEIDFSGNEALLNFSHYEAGIYLIKIKNSQGVQDTVKVIKQ